MKAITLSRRQQFLVGVLYALICPILFFLVYTEVYYKGVMSPWELLGRLSETFMFSKMIFLCMIPNYFALYVCAKKEWMGAMYGVFFPTIIVCLVTLFIYTDFSS